MTLIATYFVFGGKEESSFLKPSLSPSYHQPSMVPGAEAVRPLATNQSLRVQSLLTELKHPSPSHSILPKSGVLAEDPDGSFTGVIQKPGQNPKIKEFSYVKKGKLILTQTDYYDSQTGALYATRWQRFQNEKLRRKIDQTYRPDGSPLQRYYTLYDETGEILNRKTYPASKTPLPPELISEASSQQSL